MNRHFSLWQRLKAYKLADNIYVLMLLLLSFVVSMYLYLNPSQESPFSSELCLAMATSLLASIFCLLSDTYVQYKNSVKDQLLEGMHEFGINNLHFNKRELLQELLPTCEKELYLSGYRLILLDEISPSLTEAVNQGAQVRLIISPPWWESFKLVYGENEKVIDNYCRVFCALRNGVSSYANLSQQVQVRFINKPFFSDTYKIDHHLITGPYLHNKSVSDNRITASDFFTYDIIRKSHLYKLVEMENETLWNEASLQLDWSRFEEAYNEIRNSDLRESEKIDLIKGSCFPIQSNADVCALV